MDIEMMRAVQEEAKKLEAMGAGEQPLAFIDSNGFLICEECLANPADFPSKFCVGCDAYRDHTS